MSKWMRSAAVLAAFGLAAATPALAAQAPAAQAAPAPAAGALIESGPLAPEFGLDGAAQAFAIRYGSTDGVVGSGTVPVTAALFIPKGTPPAGGWPLIAWAHGTVGIGDDCAPSRNPRSARDRTYLDHWLGEGYAIVATDYQGLGGPGPHPYLNSRAAAYSTLDAVRAVLGGDFGLANKVLLVGQSQGAGAAFATAGYAADYAPDVNVRGTIATGLPNLAVAGATSGGDGDKVDRLIAYLLYIASAAEQIDPRYDPTAVLTDRAMPLYRRAADTCVVDMFGAVVEAGLTRANSFKTDFWRAYAPMLTHAGYPTLHIATPVFIGTGAEDVDTPAAMQKSVVDGACDAGSTIEWHVYPGLDHSGTVNRSFTDSRLFAQHVMAGHAIAGTCPQAAG
ncbi:MULTISPECIES: lipase family protein [Sphingopyxis]|uniref:Secretory lipase n=1 Tax=Sphingopyxis granuli TaxID=267128 RepID=A0AA86GVU8_9SPHN|nr:MULTISPECIES: lipase family protein [Sphingopyxis]AMG76337.1 Secretory lipase [Sphingopyxis granuli]